jgi:hypothetical protein
MTAAIFWLKTRAHWKETQVNEVTVQGSDSIRLLMQRIAETGRRIQDHDRPRIDLEAVPSSSPGLSPIPAVPASPARLS